MTTQSHQSATAFGGKVEIIGPGAQAVANCLEQEPKHTPDQPPAAGQAAHTPTPWAHTELGNGRGGRTCIKAGSEIVAQTERLLSRHPTGERYRWNEMDANAAHIVHCVNSHPALVVENKRLREALGDAVSALENIDRHIGLLGGEHAKYHVARAALAKEDV